MDKRWISVDDKVPPPSKGLLLLKNNDHDEGPIIGFYYPERKCFYPMGDSDLSLPIIVTHWYEIPK